MGVLVDKTLYLNLKLVQCIDHYSISNYKYELLYDLIPTL